MKRSTKDVGPYVELPVHAILRWEGQVRFYRKFYGAGQLVNLMLGSLTPDEVVLFTEAVNHGVDPRAATELFDGIPQAQDPLL